MVVEIIEKTLRFYREQGIAPEAVTRLHDAYIHMPLDARSRIVRANGQVASKVLSLMEVYSILTEDNIPPVIAVETALAVPNPHDFYPLDPQSLQAKEQYRRNVEAGQHPLMALAGVAEISPQANYPDYAARLAQFSKLVKGLQ